jgi:hypothetical protein
LKGQTDFGSPISTDDLQNEPYEVTFSQKLRAVDGFEFGNMPQTMRHELFDEKTKGICEGQEVKESEANWRKPPQPRLDE